VNFGQIADYPFPLPPLPEQQRIVAEIEKQLTRLEAGVAALRRARARLRRYRAAVLKAACEGRLIPQDPADEPAPVLLERILTERRARWEAEQRARGKDPKSLKYPEPAAPDTAGLPELPGGWVWASLEQLTGLITSGSRGWAKYYDQEGAVFIRAQDIKTDALRLDYVAHVTLQGESAEGTRTRVQKDDLLVTITGANVTKTALVREEITEAYVSQHVGLVRSIISNSAPYLYYWVVSPAHGRGILEENAYGAGKPGLNLDNLRDLVVAFPPLPEQHRIVAEVERRLSLVEELEAAVEANLRRAGRLRQALLQRAFEGRLVPQDPSDEPASVLLERIRAKGAEREAGGKARRKPAGRRSRRREKPSGQQLRLL
jgi:type I restriction enzyme S subunit